MNKYEREFYYTNPLDIFSFFSTKEIVGDFLMFFFKYSLEAAKQIEADGNKKPYYVQYGIKGYSYRTDYQYLIFVIGEWVSFLTENHNTMRVFRDYGILPKSTKAVKNQINRKAFAHFLSEMLRITIARDKVNKVGMESTPVDVFPLFKMAIVEKNGVCFDMKHVGFHIEQLKYFNADIEQFLADNDAYFADNETTQTAFDTAAVRAFWKKYLAKHSEGKSVLFKIFYEDLLLTPKEVMEKNLVV